MTTTPSSPLNKSSSKPNVSSPEAHNFNNNEKLASSGWLTRQQARLQNISVPEPTTQPHTLEFLTRKQQKADNVNPKSSSTIRSASCSTFSKMSSEEREKRKKTELAKVDKAIEKETFAHKSKQAAFERQAAAAKRRAELEAARLAIFFLKKGTKGTLS